MTALNGAVVFNSGTGSDSLASGLGPSTAVNSTTEGTTASYSSTTITFSGSTDLSGVSAGDLLYLVTSTGQKFFAIASVNDGADSLTVDTAPTGTASGLSWAIGGKRATWDDSNSRQLFADAKDQWTIQTETDQTISSAITLPAVGDSKLVTILGADSNRSVITQTANSEVFTSGSNTSAKLQDLKLANSNGTKTNAYGVYHSSGQAKHVYFRNVEFGDATNTLTDGWHQVSDQVNQGGIRFYDCYISVTGTGIDIGGGTGVRLYADNLFIADCGTYGIYSHGPYNTMDLRRVVVDNAGSKGFYQSNSNLTRLALDGCIFDGCGGDGVDISAAYGSSQYFVRIINSLFTNNGGYGLNAASGADNYIEQADYNAYYNNTSGARNNLSAGANDVTLSTDPYTNASSDDYTLNSTSGGGADCIDAGHPQAFPAAA